MILSCELPALPSCVCARRDGSSGHSRSLCWSSAAGTARVRSSEPSATVTDTLATPACVTELGQNGDGSPGNSLSTVIFKIGVGEEATSWEWADGGVLSVPEEEGGGDVQKLPALLCAGAALEEAFGHGSVTVPCQQEPGTLSFMFCSLSELERAP